MNIPVIESVNPACQRIFGYTQEEMLGRKVNMLMPSPYAEQHDGYIQTYLETGVPRIIGIGRELEALRKNGTTFPMELTVSEVRQDSRRHFMSIIRDVTERQAAENALRQAFSDLESKQRRLDEDLKAAAKIQESLLPSQPPSDPRIRVSWVFHPSQRIGGDIFDVVQLDEDRYAFILVDVSGHGVPSALVAVSVSQALDRDRLLESLPEHSQPAAPIQPAALLRRLDQEFPLERFNKYFTMFYLVLDLRDGRAAYSAAAHPPPMLLRSGGGHELLDRGGSIIGMGGIVPFEQGVLDLRPGDRLFMYTDGITEAEKHHGQMFGQDRLLEQVEALRDRPLEEVADLVHAAVMAHSDRPDPEDDVTLLCLEFLGQG